MGILVVVLDSIKRLLLLVITTMFVVCTALANESKTSAENIQKKTAEEENIPDIERVKEQEEQAVRSAISKSLERDLQRQYEQLQNIARLEDAFSQSLAENYFSYAGLLREARRYEEARDAYTTAMHIEKVNHGIYSMRQRAALKGLFDLNLEQGDHEEARSILNRILWVEDQNPDVTDDLAFSSILELGNFYVNLYDVSPRKNGRVLGYLRSASDLYVAAVNKYGKLPMVDMLMPYGEIALVNYYLGKKEEDSIKSTSVFNSDRFSGSGRLFGDSENADLYYFMSQSFKRAEIYLQTYISKAYDEKQQEHLIHAIINFADLQLLIRKRNKAADYYVLAWEQAQKLEEHHPLRSYFNEPVKLPAFNYARTRKGVDDRKFEQINVMFDVNHHGYPKNISISTDEVTEKSKKYHKKAISSIRKSVFRPVIKNGKIVPVERYIQNVKVFVKNET